MSQEAALSRDHLEAVGRGRAPAAGGSSPSPAIEAARLSISLGAVAADVQLGRFEVGQGDVMQFADHDGLQWVTKSNRLDAGAHRRARPWSWGRRVERLRRPSAERRAAGCRDRRRRPGPWRRRQTARADLPPWSPASDGYSGRDRDAAPPPSQTWRTGTRRKAPHTPLPGNRHRRQSACRNRARGGSGLQPSARYADVGITAIMPTSGLCRADRRTCMTGVQRQRGMSA